MEMVISSFEDRIGGKITTFLYRFRIKAVSEFFEGCAGVAFDRLNVCFH